MRIASTFVCDSIYPKKNGACAVRFSARHADIGDGFAPVETVSLVLMPGEANPYTLGAEYLLDLAAVPKPKPDKKAKPGAPAK